MNVRKYRNWRLRSEIYGRFFAFNNLKYWIKPLRKQVLPFKEYLIPYTMWESQMRTILPLKTYTRCKCFNNSSTISLFLQEFLDRIVSDDEHYCYVLYYDQPSLSVSSELSAVTEKCNLEACDYTSWMKSFLIQLIAIILPLLISICTNLLSII